MTGQPSLPPNVVTQKPDITQIRLEALRYVPTYSNANGDPRPIPDIITDAKLIEAYILGEPK